MSMTRAQLAAAYKAKHGALVEPVQGFDSLAKILWLAYSMGRQRGFTDLGTILLAVALAFLFGYALTSLPLLRSGLSPRQVVPLALASDTASITIMELVDNAIMLLIPGAMDAGLDEIGFWAALAAALLIAGSAAYPVNRWLISRGKGHAVVHSHH